MKRGHLSLDVCRHACMTTAAFCFLLRSEVSPSLGEHAQLGLEDSGTKSCRCPGQPTEPRWAWGKHNGKHWETSLTTPWGQAGLCESYWAGADMGWGREGQNSRGRAGKGGDEKAWTTFGGKGTCILTTTSILSLVSPLCLIFFLIDLSYRGLKEHLGPRPLDLSGMLKYRCLSGTIV